MSSKIFLALGLFLILHSCQEKTSVSHESPTYNYGTKSDSALHYFNRGWEQIMDYGQWTLSEESFRQAVHFDSSFWIGKSLVGKITQDLDERTELLNELEEVKSFISEDNYLLLNITSKTLELMNARDQRTKLAPGFYEALYKLGETNYRKFVHKYPEESYMKAEYIEFLHHNIGAQQALDSLNILTNQYQKELPFFIGYSALLESELGNHEKALARAKILKEKIDDSGIPQPYVIYAEIYANMDSLTLAYDFIEKAVQLDTNHMIAKRLKDQIDGRLNLTRN